MGFLIMKNCRMGTTSCATNIDTKRIMKMAQGNHVRNSPTMPVSVMRNGKKVMEMASVAEIIDLKKWRAASIEACQRDTPSAM